VEQIKKVYGDMGWKRKKKKQIENLNFQDERLIWEEGTYSGIHTEKGGKKSKTRRTTSVVDMLHSNKDGEEKNRTAGERFIVQQTARVSR